MVAHHYRGRARCAAPQRIPPVTVTVPQCSPPPLTPPHRGRRRASRKDSSIAYTAVGLRMEVCHGAAVPPRSDGTGAASYVTFTSSSLIGAARTAPHRYCGWSFRPRSIRSEDAGSPGNRCSKRPADQRAHTLTIEVTGRQNASRRVLSPSTRSDCRATVSRLQKPIRPSLQRRVFAPDWSVDTSRAWSAEFAALSTTRPRKRPLPLPDRISWIVLAGPRPGSLA